MSALRPLLVFALVAALLLAGCSLPIGNDKAGRPRGASTASPGDGGAANGSLPVGQTEPPGPRSTPSPAPVVGGHVTEIIPLYPRTLNPLFAENEAQERVSSLLFEGLMRIDPETRTPAPALASDVQRSPDGLRYTFTLRPGVTWHDGSPLTASDVVWTYDVLRDGQMQAPLLPYAERIRSVTAAGDASVTFTLSEPYSPFLARLATVPIIPRGPFAGLSRQRLRARLLGWQQPVGTGPFRWVGAKPGQSIELAAYRRYHGGEPLLDRYIFRVLRDPAAVQQALSGGEADLAWLPPALVAELAEQDFLSEATIGTPTTTMLGFNLDPDRSGKLLDPRVRRALAHALDLQRIADSLRGVIRPATGYQPPTSPAYRERRSAPYAYDPARARALLSEAGWRDTDRDGVRQKGDRTLTIVLAVNRVPEGFPQTLGPSYDAAVARIIADWRAVGVGVRVVEEGWEQFASRLFGARDFDAALLTVSGDADPDVSYLWSTEAYTQSFNIGRYSSRKVDALLDAGLRASGTEDRARLYDQLEAQLVADVPAVPLGSTQEVVVRNNRLAGATSDYWSALQHVDAHRWYVQDGR